MWALSHHPHKALYTPPQNQDGTWGKKPFFSRQSAEKGPFSVSMIACGSSSRLVGVRVYGRDFDEPWSHFCNEPRPSHWEDGIPGKG